MLSGEAVSGEIPQSLKDIMIAKLHQHNQPSREKIFTTMDFMQSYSICIAYIYYYNGRNTIVLVDAKYLSGAIIRHMFLS